MRKHVIVGAIALCSAGTYLSAQATQQPRGTSPAQTTSADRQGTTTTTLSGCVYRERDVPGRTPNVAERVGVLEDYILADVGATGAQSSASTAAKGATGTSGTQGSARGMATMYKLEHIADDKLSAMVGKRVEVMGRIDAEPGDAPPAGAAGKDRSVGPDRVELPEFEVTSIKEIAGSCPSMPSKP